MSDTFICAMCGGQFEKGWSDEEMEIEAAEIWGDIPEEEKAIICDDCFNKIHPDKFPIVVKVARAILKRQIQGKG